MSVGAMVAVRVVRWQGAGNLQAKKAGAVDAVSWFALRSVA